MDLRTAAFELRAKHFPWTVPYRARRVLGFIGLAWTMLNIWMLGVIMADMKEAVAAIGPRDLALGLTLHLVCAMALLWQMPPKQVQGA